MVAFALFVVLLTLFATAKEKTALKNISVKIVANRLLLQPIPSCLEHVGTTLLTTPRKVTLRSVLSY